MGIEESSLLRIMPTTRVNHNFSVYVKSNSANARLITYDGTSTTISSGHTGDGTWQRMSITYTPSSVSVPFECFVGIISSSNTAVAISSGYYVQFKKAKLEINCKHLIMFLEDTRTS
jgi:hypothetical protein